MAETDAYIGYRSAGRRKPQQNDRRAAANAPLAALRGMVSGVLGAPGDIESFVRMLPGLSEQTVLPTSEDIEKRLPLRAVSETPAGRAFTTAGQLGGGFYTGPGSPLRAIAALPSAVGRAGRDFAMAAGQPPVNVVKPKGGNWLAGSVERVVEPMKRGPLDEGQRLIGSGLMTPEAAARSPDIAMNRWLDQKLARYIRNEMATPEDPVRALAERGVLHVEPENLTYGRHTVHPSGEVFERLGQSEAARQWETAADQAIYPNQAGYLARAKELDTNPWLLKVPPETTVHEIGPRGAEFNQLGFGHLADELRNMLDPASGLPRELLLTPEQLSKVTVPQAVERVAKVNEWRAAQKAEADLARANNAATQVFKEYPDKGFKWVELRAPEADVSDIRFEKAAEGVRAFDAEGNRLVSPGGYNVFANEEQALMQLRGERASKPLADALKYEGETMGHCVGGYCPDVLEGRSKIYSLRDKKGQPHVTIEVTPGRKLTEKDLPDDVRDMLAEQYGDESREVFEAAVQRYLQERAVPDEIVQIKGKQNRAPKEEYLPMVQDFVRSQQWGRVGDLENTGFIRIDPESDLAAAFKKVGKEPPPYVNQGELTNLLKWNRGEGDLPEGFASGGLVAAGAIPYEPAKIDAIVNSLREELDGY